MPRTITTIQVDVEFYNRIADLRAHVSMELRFKERSLGLGPMLGLLVDHWQAHPPEAEWLREQAKIYPKRGRPPKHALGSPASIGGKDRMLGHVVFSRRIQPGVAHQIFYCKKCTMEWMTWDTPRPPSACPGDGITVSIFSLKTWTKSELLALGFEADEVEWAQP